MYLVTLELALKEGLKNEAVKDPWFVLTPDSYSYLRLYTGDRLSRANASQDVAEATKKIKKSFDAVHAKAIELYGTAALQASLAYPSGSKYPLDANREFKPLPEIPLAFVADFTNAVDFIELELNGTTHYIVEKITGRFKNEIPASSWFSLYTTCRIMEGTLKTITFKQAESTKENEP
jgi:hypothetical protein